MSVERKAPPEYCIIKIPSLLHWCDRVKALADEVYEIWAFDRNLHVHVADLSPSHELYFLGYDEAPKLEISEQELEELGDLINDAEVRLHDYMYVCIIDRLAEKKSELIQKVEIDFDGNGLDEDEDPFQKIAEGWATGALRF